jgi:hypothetical protein
MMQVAAADTYDDYVICRGFDPRIRKFIDYEAGNANKPGISVAKPFGNRVVSSYEVGQIFPAFLPTQGYAGAGKYENYTPPSPTDVDWRVGQTSGTASPEATGGHPQDLSAGISALTDHNSQLVQWLLITGGGTEAKVLWGVAKTNWEDNGANCDSVDVNPCEDCEGTNPDAGTTHTVYLPKNAERDPNVIAGEVIGYEISSNATYCCVSDYLDDKIGTIKMWALSSGAIPPGWGICDGNGNSVVNGGSAIDLVDRFVRGASTSGASGGGNDHTHEFTFTIEPHTTAELAISLDHTHNITVEPHTVEQLRHEHQIVTGTPFDEGTGVERDKPGFCTNWPTAAETTEGDCTGLPWGPLEHFADIDPAYGGGVYPAQELEHNWTFTINEAENLPEYIEMIFIERLDNSA